MHEPPNEESATLLAHSFCSAWLTLSCRRIWMNSTLTPPAQRIRKTPSCVIFGGHGIGLLRFFGSPGLPFRLAPPRAASHLTRSGETAL